MSTDIIPTVPADCFLLTPKTKRRVGDMFWSSTLRKWCETAVGDGEIPEHGTWIRRLKVVTVTQTELLPPARPVTVAPRAANAKQAPADWTKHCTPLSYIISDPFSDEDQILVYQLDELALALHFVKLADHDWCSLYVYFQDNKTYDYDRHLLCWREKGEVRDPLKLMPYALCASRS